MEFDGEVWKRTGNGLWGITDRAITKAVARAANRTATGTRAQMSKRIRTRVNLKARDVKESIDIVSRATFRNPRAILKFEFNPVPLKAYGANQRKDGVSVRVLKGEGRKVIKHAHKQSMYGGHVFSREKDSSAGTDSGLVHRKPYLKMWGPTVKHQAELLLPGLEEEYISPTFEKRLAEQIEWERDKARKKALERVR